MQEKIEKLKTYNLKCLHMKMKISGIKEKVTMVKKEKESNQLLTSVGTLKQDMQSQSTKENLIHIQEDKMNSPLGCLSKQITLSMLH